MSGQIFETYAFGEVYKSYLNAGIRPPLHFFRTNDRKEIDMLIEQNGTLYPIEVKKTASPGKNDMKNFNAVDALASTDVPDELRTFKREIGLGSVLCLTQDTFPIGQNAWAFPVWAV